MKYIIGLIFLSVWNTSIACSFFTGIERFVGDIEGFERKFQNERIYLLPKPEVKITSVTRGTAAPGASCDDAGIITLLVTWPKESLYSLDEIGFYFRASGNVASKYIFPNVPVASTKAKGNEVEFMFVWLDGHPKQQKPMDFELEVFAVNRGYEIGSSEKVVVQAPKG